MSVLIGTKITVAAKRSVSAAAALLAAAAVFALVGCDRTEGLPNPASQTVQTASASAAAPIGYVYITNNGEGTLSEFSRGADGNLNFLRTAKAGAVNGPTGIAIDPSSRFLYVANEGDSRIHQFRIERDTGELAPIGEGAVDDGSASRPQQIAISPRGDFLYVTNPGKSSGGKNNGGSIAEYAIDPTTGALKPLETFRGGGLQQPLGIAFMPNGKFIYVSDLGAGTLVAFAVETSGKLKLVSSTPSLGDKPGRPGLIAVRPSGSFVYTADRSQGAVVVAKAAEDGKLSVTGTYHVGISTSGPFGIALATVGPNVFVYTANLVSDTVSSLAVKPNTMDLVGECPTGMGNPTGMVADPGGRNLYVVNRDSATVAQFAIGATKGVALIPAASIFTEDSPSETSHPLYIATTRWDAPASAADPRSSGRTHSRTTRIGAGRVRLQAAGLPEAAGPAYPRAPLSSTGG
ncbi:MAG TPA: beta-propeller fold lactonase family protein [Candidatus Binataceae bacterium]|jgi:6-phosphogluconolactonase|nr:beta-propeller fold lactonase family protein [Candidatus Binataceae bacterium]